MSSNVLNMSGCIVARSTAHVPPIDQPTMPQLAVGGTHAVVRLHERHDVLGQVVGGVAACAVDAFGVVVEGAARVDEDEYRRVPGVSGGEVVDGLDRVARPQPVGRRVELTADHHQRRQRRRRVRCEPGRRKVDELAAVLEPRRRRTDGDRHHGALWPGSAATAASPPPSPDRSGRAEVRRSAGSRPSGRWGSSPPTGSGQDAAHRMHSGNATTAALRRHHRAPRQPVTSTTAETPTAAIQIHSNFGAGSPARPSDEMYQ